MHNIKEMNMKLWNLLLICFLPIVGCENFIEIDPPKTEISEASVYFDDVSATAAIMGIYSELGNRELGIGSGGITVYGGLSADEFFSYTLNDSFFDNSVLPTNGTIRSLWNEAYSIIFSANSVIEGIRSSSSISLELRDQLDGEAHLMRAFLHFYLVNLFGDVPYITSTDFKVNTDATRMPKAQVYENIISDLKEAKNLLVSDYSFSNGERTRPNRSVATAMLARVYLYAKDWANAENFASEALGNSDVYRLETDINKVFLKDSPEAIWQFAPVKPSINTIEGYRLILISTPNLLTLSSGLLKSFEIGDERLSNWVGTFTSGTNTYNYPFKYKIRTSTSVEEYYMILRLAEQYLIRAEARAQQNKLGEAISDLDKIRERAGTSLISDIQPAIGKAALLDTILQERRKEFFAEWSHRWLDLKRTERADAVLAPIKTDWQPTDVLYPIPQVQIDRNPNMGQNSGY